MRPQTLIIAACLAAGLTFAARAGERDCGVPSRGEKHGACAGEDGRSCGASEHGAGLSCRGGKCGRCEAVCGHCEADCKTVPMKKTCFEVECKTICIPPVKFPWESCCEMKCGRLRTIRVLKKSEKVVGETLTCEWKTHATGCGHGSGGGCCDVAPEASPQPVPEAPPVPQAKPATPEPSVKKASWLRFLRLR